MFSFNHQNNLDNTRWEGKFIIFTHVFVLCVVLCSFLMAINYLIFIIFLSENVLIFSLFLKYIFAGDRILSWQFSTFSTWKMCHFFLDSMVSDERSTFSQIVFLLQAKCYFSCAIFKIIYFVLVFESSTVICLLWILWGLTLLGFAKSLEPVDLCLMPNLGHYQSLFLQIFF